MKTKIKDVHDYFRDKIVKGDYEIVKISEHTIQLLVDGGYNFVIWWANKESYIHTYNDSFMVLLFRVKDKISIWSNLRKIREKHILDVVLKEKEAIYKELKKQFDGK